MEIPQWAADAIRAAEKVQVSLTLKKAKRADVRLTKDEGLYDEIGRVFENKVYWVFTDTGHCYALVNGLWLFQELINGLGPNAWRKIANFK